MYFHGVGPEGRPEERQQPVQGEPQRCGKEGVGDATTARERLAIPKDFHRFADRRVGQSPVRRSPVSSVFDSSRRRPK